MLTFFRTFYSSKKEKDPGKKSITDSIKKSACNIENKNKGFLSSQSAY